MSWLDFFLIMVITGRLWSMDRRLRQMQRRLDATNHGAKAPFSNRGDLE